jgi:DNA-binding response OmpR family regulator
MNEEYKERQSSDYTILVVEDDNRVASSLYKGLTEEGYDVSGANSLAEAYAVLENQEVSLVILDLGLPDGNGISLLQHIRKQATTTPVIIVTASDSISEKVSALDQGADDYLTKPFAFPELLARVRARLRTSQQRSNTSIQVGNLVIDRMQRSVKRGNTTIHLTQLEFDLLTYLAAAAGHPVSRDTLTRDVWNINSRATSMDKVIDVHVSHLRAKVDIEPYPKLIHTIRGVGFLLSENTP